MYHKPYVHWFKFLTYCNDVEVNLMVCSAHLCMVTGAIEHLPDHTMGEVRHVKDVSVTVLFILVSSYS